MAVMEMEMEDAPPNDPEVQAKLLGDEFRTIMSRKSRSNASSRGSPTKSIKDHGSNSHQDKSFETISITQNSSPARRQGVPDGNQSVISDLTDGVKVRRKWPSHVPKSRDEVAEKNLDSDFTKKTESTFMESFLESIAQFCLDPASAMGCGSPVVEREERKKDAEETFLGKIITCQMIDMDDLTCSCGSVY